MLKFNSYISVPRLNTNNIGIYNLLAHFLVIFSGFYLFKYSTIAPVYFIYFSLMPIVSILFLFKQKIKFNYILISPIIIILYLIMTQAFLDCRMLTLFVYSSSISFFIFTFLLISNINRKEIISISNKFIIFSILLLTADALYRLSEFKLSTFLLNFYIFKENGLIYVDSNFTGIYALVLFFFTYYLKSINKLRRYDLFMLISFVLCLLSFSRMSITTLIFCYNFLLIKKQNLLIKLICLSFLLIGSIVFIHFSFINDGSFESKLSLFRHIFIFYEERTFFEILFGMGYNNSEAFLGIAPHTFLTTSLLETGIIGTILSLLFFLVVTLATKGKALIIICPLLINGFSLWAPPMHYVYATLAIILVLSKRRLICYENSTGK